LEESCRSSRRPCPPPIEAAEAGGYGRAPLGRQSCHRSGVTSLVAALLRNRSPLEPKTSAGRVQDLLCFVGTNLSTNRLFAGL
jgi:hypothetical protein